MRTSAIVVAGLALAVLTGVIALANPYARVGAAYAAKTLCSEIFLAGRDETSVRATDLAGVNPMIAKVDARVDLPRRRVVASLFGLGRAVAIYREDYGCTIAAGGPPETLPALPPITTGAAWRQAPDEEGSAMPGVDYAALGAALDAAMADAPAANRSIFVVVQGAVVGSRFAPGFGETTPMLSWSMAKSVTATIAGAAVERGYIRLEDPAPVPEWRGDAARSAITWNDLLRMQSGLSFTEVYGPGSDATKMLFAARDAGAVAAAKPLKHAPGAHWSYSSGTTNLIARTLRQVLAEKGIDYSVFAREAVFSPIGAASFVMEPDSAGTPIGSSYMYATVGDWARLGALYLKDGLAGNVRVLPEGWVAAATRAEAPADGQYGLQIWLNGDGAEGRARAYPGVPANMYYFSGHEGQFVYVAPDKRMIIVRTGITRGADPEKVFGPTLAALYAAVGEAKTP
jgi:hypothetical protein